MIEFFERARRAFKDTRAQDLVEYALIAGFVAMSLSAVFPAAARPWRRLARKIAKVSRTCRRHQLQLQLLRFVQ